MQNCKLFSFSMQMQYDIMKLHKGQILFWNRKYKVREKTSDEKKIREKKYWTGECKFSWSA